MWLVGVVIRRCIDILIIIINFPYSTCIRSFFGSSILTSLLILKCFFGLKNKNKKPKWRFLTSRGAHVNCAIMAVLYSHPIGNQPRTRWWCLKCVKVYPPRDIRPFVMYCVNGKPRSSLRPVHTAHSMRIQSGLMRIGLR